MKKSKIPFALGLTGAIICLIGGFCVTICASVADALTEGATNFELFGWLLGVGSGFVGLIGAIVSINKEKIGGILMLTAFAMAAGLVVIFGFAGVMTLIIGAIFLMVAGILDLTMKPVQ